MSDENVNATANGPMLSVEEVTQIIQKMREDQESFLQQQRDVIILQVLETIQHSGVMPSTDKLPQKASKKYQHSSTARLEKNLHTLVHHSLAESGLDFPHVHNTAHETSSQRPQELVRVMDSPKKKQIILSRREVEGGETSGSLSVENEDHDNDESLHEIPSQDTSQALSKSPLRIREPSNRRKRGLRLEKRRRHRHNNRSRSRLDTIEDDYTEFADPIHAAFNAVRKKVDLRTLAILDRSKVLLGQVKQFSSADGKTSFVDKLRQRHRIAEQGGDAISPVKSPEDAVTSNLYDDTNQLDHQTVDIERDGKSSSSLELKTDENVSLPIDRSAIRCDLDLLQPPPKSPDNENEWENELARQILTIYATSVKAKTLEKASSNNLGKKQSDNQNQGDGSTGRREKKRLQSACKSRASSDRGKNLGTSCSLPVIRSNSSFRSTKQPIRTSCSPSAVHYSWEPSQRREDGRVIINMPRVPRPIWFAGTGAVKAVWCALADGFTKLRPQNGSPRKSNSSASNTSMCDHRLCEEVRQLEAKKKFAQCITTLESLLVALVRARGVDELETKLWKQLVVTCNAFASRCIDYQKFPAGLQLMKQAEHLINNSILVDSKMRMELLAYLYDTYAHYYYRRRKPHAGLQYILKAHEIHSKQSSWSHLAKCRLHIANLLSFQIKHAEAMRYMASILEMIEENKLEETSEGGGGASAQKLCLAAVCYNNLTVEQLHMREFEAASVSSANAQRLAKLCLSYSNRWLAQFQATSDCVALAIATLMEDINADKGPVADWKSLPPAEE